MRAYNPNRPAYRVTPDTADDLDEIDARAFASRRQDVAGVGYRRNQRTRQSRERR